ncbi:MAG: hypothetical protein FWD73_07235 [Polyangiaceae bacterium]|nr:hypothetical protein [Polyangiaceae bacterium]
MAIGLTLSLAEEVLDEEMVLKGIHDLGFTSTIKTSETSTKHPVFHFTSCYDTLGFLVNLVKSMGPENGVTDVWLLGGGGRTVEFEYRQFLSFRFNNDFEANDCFERALRMIFRLMSHVRTRAYLETSHSDEICFFNEDKSVLYKKSSSLFDLIDIKKEFSDWKVIEVAM